MADSYSYDMQRLQQDAIRRAREMQSRAQNVVAQQQIPTAATPVQNQSVRSIPPVQIPQPTKHLPPREQHEPVHEQHEPGSEPLKNMLSPVQDIFDSLMKDSEKTLILVLIVLLVEEKSDPGVIFALMYLIL